MNTEICAKYYDAEAKDWKSDGITMIEESGITVNALSSFCFHIEHTTLFGVFEEEFPGKVDKLNTIDDLYTGFLLYAMIIINIWLIIGAIVGFFLDKSKPVNISQNESSKVKDADQVYVSMKQTHPEAVAEGEAPREPEVEDHETQ